MKTLASFTAALLLILNLSSFTADESKMNMNHALEIYINAITKGKTKLLPTVLDNNVRLTVTKDNKVVNYNKADIIKSLKGTEDLVQDCNTDYSVVDSSENNALIKVTMTYPDFSKVTILNMVNASGGWKITTISTSFK